MDNLPPLKPGSPAGCPPLPAGAQLIFAQAGHMAKAGIAFAKTTMHWEVTGPMDEGGMCRAMDFLSRSRDFLCLGLENREGIGTLVTATPEPIRIETIAPEDLPGEMSAWSTRQNPASKAPACTLRLFKLGEESYAIGISGPHDLLDIWTIQQTLFSLTRLYNAALDQQTIPPDQSPGFRDLAAWYDDLLASGRLEASGRFWRNLLDDTAQVFATPPDPSPGTSHPMTAVHSFLPLDPGRCRAFEAGVRAAGASVFEGYFTLFNLTLAKVTGKKNLLSAFVASLRRVPGIGDVHGCLLNRFYIPVRLAGKTDFYAILGQVSGTLKSAKAHCLWPAWKDVDPEGTGYPGLFFHYAPPDKGQDAEFRDLSVSPVKLVRPTHWPHPMAFQVTADPDRPMLFSIGQSGFCTPHWLETLQKTFAEILEGI